MKKRTHSDLSKENIDREEDDLVFAAFEKNRAPMKSTVSIVDFRREMQNNRLVIGQIVKGLNSNPT